MMNVTIEREKKKLEVVTYTQKKEQFIIASVVEKKAIFLLNNGKK
jgi:hypothetical protein